MEGINKDLHKSVFQGIKFVFQYNGGVYCPRRDEKMPYQLEPANQRLAD